MPRGRKTEPSRQTSFEVVIPDKLYFRIREVSKLTNTKAYVLRYWESEFPTLNPERKSGQRLYRRKDVETVFRIKRLLYDEGYRIDGAKRRLRELSGEAPSASAKALAAELKQALGELEKIVDEDERM